MSDRKYRQRGYQESDRDRKPGPKPAGPGGPPPRGDRPEGPRTPNLMPTREVIRCAKCGVEVSTPYGYDNRCSKCGVETHTCGQCTYFDPGRPVPVHAAGVRADRREGREEQLHALGAAQDRRESHPLGADRLGPARVRRSVQVAALPLPRRRSTSTRHHGHGRLSTHVAGCARSATEPEGHGYVGVFEHRRAKQTFGARHPSTKRGKEIDDVQRNLRQGGLGSGQSCCSPLSSA